MTDIAPVTATVPIPRWHKVALLVAGLQCLIWGVFIILMPERSAIVYGFDRPPQEIFLWQGTGLVIFLYGVGYAIASANPHQHWSVIVVGLLAKTLGPAGLLWSVVQGTVPARVLLLIPVNDLIWWLPFGLILAEVHAQQRCR